MKRLMAIPVVLVLTGCGPSFPTIDSSALQEAVAQVTAQTVKICNYLPTNETVVNILTASAALETAYNIAKSICDAVTGPAPLASPVQGTPRLGDENQCPMVRGVCIEGQFLQGKPSDRVEHSTPEGPTPAPAPVPETAP